MAKKKVTQSQKEKPQQKQEESVKADQVSAAAMDSDAPEKIENLKSLNQMLIKEAFERRQQVDSLVQSNKSLKVDLNMSISEKDTLRSELTQLGEKAAGLELQRTVVSVFVASQVSEKTEVVERKVKDLEVELRDLGTVIAEKENEIGKLNVLLSGIEGELANEKEVSRRVCLDRDAIKDDLERQIKEGNKLRASLIEFEKRTTSLEKENGEVRVLYDAEVEKREEGEMKIGSITREKDSIEKSLVESNKLIDELQEELHEIVKEKKGVEEEKIVEIVKRQELEKTVGELREQLIDLQNKDEKLCLNMAELVNKCEEDDERRTDMGREIAQLVEERKLSEKRIEVLAYEKNEVEKVYSETLKELAEQKNKIVDMVSEKIILLEAKHRLNTEVQALHSEVGELKAMVLKLEESSLVEVEKIKNLESEVGKYKGKFEEVKVEKDGMETCLNAEKLNASRLNYMIRELEKKIEDSIEAVNDVKAENVAMYTEKVDLESQCEKLKYEVTCLKNTLTVADANSEVLVNMLKDTAMFCSKDERDLRVSDEEIDGDSEKHVMEFEVIKNAFKSKESKVEKMKKQLEFLQDSVVEAQKKKSFWTVLSSAATLLAAVSLAYVARGH